MRIALITIEYPPDQSSYGLGTYIHTLATALTQRGHIVHVITRSSHKNVIERNGNLTVHRIGPPRQKITETLNTITIAQMITTSFLVEWQYRKHLSKKLEELIQTEGLDIIESVDAAAESLFYQPTKHPDIPFIVKLHNSISVLELFDKSIPEWLRKVLRYFERLLLLKASHITAPSQSGAALNTREMRIEQHVHIIPNPPAQFSQLSFTTPTEDPNLVLFVGRITAMKGLQVLIKAIPKVLDIVPEAYFLLVGGDPLSESRFLLNKAKLLETLPKNYYPAVRFIGRYLTSKWQDSINKLLFVSFLPCLITFRIPA